MTGLRIAALLLVAAAGGLAACASAPPGPRQDLDRAVDDFIDGDYRAAVTKLDAVVAASSDDAVRREAYTYLGRAHMALGETDAAIDAFARGVQLGDTGPCVAYLELLKQYVEGKPAALHMRDVLTRGQLAGAIVRLFLNGAPDDPTGPTPLAQLARRGWMPALADGYDHADEPVTHASLYVVTARILSDAGRAREVDHIMPGGYRAASRKTGPVSGAEGLAVLERVRALTTK
ncbi:MAG: tetratricopeptide repeat protein [Candidatus Latescibacteria bacterium]|nr:tetratricopeptide repeat protein [Candidatus Latescibacterota bacterium]